MFVDKDQVQLLAHGLSVDIQNALSSLMVAENLSVLVKVGNNQQKESLANQEIQARTKEFYNFLIQIPSCFGTDISQVALKEVVQNLCHASEKYHMYTTLHLQSQWLFNVLQKEIQSLKNFTRGAFFNLSFSPTLQTSKALDERDKITIYGERFAPDMLTTPNILLRARTLIPRLKIGLEDLSNQGPLPLFSKNETPTT